MYFPIHNNGELNTLQCLAMTLGTNLPDEDRTKRLVHVWHDLKIRYHVGKKRTPLTEGVPMSVGECDTYTAAVVLAQDMGVPDMPHDAEEVAIRLSKRTLLIGKWATTLLDDVVVWDPYVGGALMDILGQLVAAHEANDGETADEAAAMLREGYPSFADRLRASLEADS